jgi:TRAP-type mannitol/chloroaromatic compound transport system substrate-binding protein
MPIQSSSRVIACGIALSACLAAGPADARDDVLHWRVNSLLYPKIFGEAGTHFSETVYRLSEGSFVIEFHDRLVLDQDTFGALDAGLVDAVWGSAGHHHREDPALTIFSGFPFSPAPEGFTAWMQSGGGSEALDAIYDRHGLKSLYWAFFLRRVAAGSSHRSQRSMISTGLPCAASDMARGCCESSASCLTRFRPRTSARRWKAA